MALLERTLARTEERAPALRLRDEEGRWLSLVDPSGGPVVIAIAAAWDVGASTAHAEALRAELRGFGATLMLVDHDSVWRVRPDDPIDRLHVDGEVAALRDLTGADAPFDLAVLLLDPQGKVRFRHVERGATHGDRAGRVLAALRSASAALRSGAPRPLLSLTRRELLISTLVTGLALSLGGCDHNPPETKAPGGPAGPATDGLVEVHLDVNGEARKLRIEPRVTLLDALREQLGLTGTKKGCDHGQCGACTVHVGGKRILSCLTLAIMHQGAPITTIEGLSKGAELHPMQACFVQHDGYQCGFCTPGQIMSAVALLREGHARSDAEVREQMSGNLCRCGAYPNIVAAIQDARGKA